jgi:hypothetical protein
MATMDAEVQSLDIVLVHSDGNIISLGSLYRLIGNEQGPVSKIGFR